MNLTKKVWLFYHHFTPWNNDISNSDIWRSYIFRSCSSVTFQMFFYVLWIPAVYFWKVQLLFFADGAFLKVTWQPHSFLEIFSPWIFLNEIIAELHFSQKFAASKALAHDVASHTKTALWQREFSEASTFLLGKIRYVMFLLLLCWVC